MIGRIVGGAERWRASASPLARFMRALWASLASIIRLPRRGVYPERSRRAPRNDKMKNKIDLFHAK